MKHAWSILLPALLFLLFQSTTSFAADKAFLGVVPDKDVSVSVKGYERGLRVSRVVEDGPAEAAGMRSGDVLVSLGGKPVQDGDDLSFYLRKFEPGEEVELVWVHDGDLRSGTTELSAREKSDVRIQVMGKDLVSSFDNRAFLGVSTLSINKNLLDFFGVDDGYGILIDTVVRGSAAELAGVQVGDVLVSINGEAVDSPGRLRRLIQKYDPGERVTLKLVRERVAFDVQLELGDRDMSDADPRWSLPAGPETPAVPELPVLPAGDGSRGVDVRFIPGMKGVEKSYHLLRDLFGTSLACVTR